MKSCTFFGHRDTPDEIKPKLKSAIIDLIENHNVTMFYMGCEGSFDKMAYSTLKELKSLYPHIDYVRVLAFMPRKTNEDYSNTILPEVVATSHPRYAISRRNEWLVEKCDYVVAYVLTSYGGAYRYYTLAKQKGKSIINLAKNKVQEHYCILELYLVTRTGIEPMIPP